MCSRIARATLAALLLAIVGGTVSSAAAEPFFEAEMRWQGLSGAGWQLGDLHASLRLSTSDRGRIDLRARSLTLDGLEADLSGVRIRCDDLVLEGDAGIHCNRGEITAQMQAREILQVPLTFHWSPATTEVSVGEGRFAGGTLSAHAVMDGSGHRLVVDAAGQGLAALLPVLLPPDRMGGIRVTGGTVASLRLETDTSAVPVRIEARINGLTASSDSGNQASQNLDLHLRLNGSRDGVIDLSLEPRSGELFIAPVYLDSGTMVGARAWLRMEPVAGGGSRYQGGLDHAPRLGLQFTGVAPAAGAFPAEVRVSFASDSLALAFEPYLQPAAMMYDYPLEQLAGRTSGNLSWRSNRLERLELNLSEVDFAADGGRLELFGLTADIDWARDAQSRRWRVAFAGGRTYAVPLGPFRADLESRGGAIELLSATPLPVFDGQLRVDSLSAEGMGGGDPAWRFAGSLAAVSLEHVSAAFGWPVLSGTVSGVIPEVRGAQDRVTVDGTLLVRVFDGEFALREMMLERPFGPIPRLSAQVDIGDLDLEAVTRTFDVGLIEGRLEGQVRDLVLEDWLPAQFDAWFATPQESSGPQRISQRAVETLSAIGGGGASRALSRGFLGFFESFNYRRLGIRCRLRAGICEMDGVAPAGDGYYLVEGSGLPRIDVIAYNRQVDWEELVARLAAAARSDGPVVQ